MSETGYWARRLRRHALLAALTVAATAAVALANRSPQTVHRLSLGTAYAGLMLLAVSLAIGPIRVLKARPNPVSTDLRRDVGIWAALAGLAHVVFGLQVHMRGKFWLYFVYPPGQGGVVPLRHDIFGAANWPGLGATLILVVLLVISNDVALRRLGRQRWKALQRWSYAGALLTLVHGVVFQVIEKRQLPFVLVFVATCSAALAFQAAGLLVLRGHARKDS